MSKESRFWKDLKTNFRLSWMSRIENALGNGTPDVHYCHNGHSGWIELKAEQTFPNKIDFEPGQPLWHEKYWRSGGNCFVFLKVIDAQEIYIWSGKFAMDLAKPNGCHDVLPMLIVRMHEKGYKELYEMFTEEENVTDFPLRNY